MTDILTLVFRTFTSQQSVEKGPRPSPGPLSTLLVGEHRQSRAVLLLAAVTAASEMGFKVVFFAQTQIQSLPASLQRCIPSLSPDALKKITFFYPRTLEELLQQVASLHQSPAPPALIIADGLEGFLKGRAVEGKGVGHLGEQSSAAHLSALLCDTAAFLTQVLEQRGSSASPCRIIASFLPDADSSCADPILDVLDRYFQVRCTLEQDRSYEVVAAAAEEAWHVYLSGRGVADEASEHAAAAVLEWKLLTFPDGLMEFKPVV